MGDARAGSEGIVTGYMSAEDRLSVIRDWREAQQNPDRLARMRRHAVDIITDDEILAHDLLAGLDEDQRLDYLESAADNLAGGLARYLDWWVLNDAPPRWPIGS
jgi:hypothetical protein